MIDWIHYYIPEIVYGSIALFLVVFMGLSIWREKKNPYVSDIDRIIPKLNEIIRLLEK